MNRRASLAVAGTVGIFLLVQLGALALVEPFKSAGFQDVQNPSDPTNSLWYVLAILVATGVMLAAIRYGADVLIRALVIGSSAFIAFYVFAVLVPPVLVVGGWNVVAVGFAVLLAGALLAYPEWYVIDASGVVMGAGAAGLFGINFGILPALILLVVLAVYDAISVYGTEHMLTLASGVMELRLPVVLVIPLTLSYSFLDSEDLFLDSEDSLLDSEVPDAARNGDDDAGTDGPTATNGGEGDGRPEDDDRPDDAEGGQRDTEDAEDAEDAEEEDDPFERDAFFVGLGDAVMPAVLVASAGFFQPAGVPTLGVPVIALTLPALTAMVGTLLGLLVLMWLVMKGRAHAGLPLLNGGAIAGYLVGSLAAGVPLVEALGLAPYL